MASYEGPIVDVDVHHNLKRDDDLIPYLPAEWRPYAQGHGRRDASGRPGFPAYPPGWAASALLPNMGKLADSFPPDGNRPGTDLPMLRRQLLDKFGYHRAILTHQVGDFPPHLNHYYAAAVCQAANDWNIDTWLNVDDRLYSLVVAPSQLPDVAAAEIRRAGAHPRMVGVLVAGNPVGRPLGDPIYTPIHEAAAELDLPIVFHPSQCDRPTSLIRNVGGPMPTSMQRVAESGQSAAHYMTSFIVHGVFEKYPNLRLLFTEYGCSWLPTLVWRLDENYDLLRFESPWVKRWPSEYILDHVRLSTQPLEESHDDRFALAKLMQTVDGADEVLCFSTDYPHISYDDPPHIARLLPVAWHRKVFCDNACRLFGWPLPAADWASPSLAAAGD